MATSASAVVNFTGVGTDGKLSLSYTTTGGDLPRGFALKCSVQGGDVVSITAGDITVPAIDPCDLTNIDYAFTAVDGGGSYAIGEGHPLADPCNPGVLSVTTDIDYFSVCFGVLDNTGNQGAGPATASPLIEIPMDLGSDPCVYIVVDEDNLRGGVAGSQLTTNLPIIVKVVAPAAPADCVKGTATFYGDWVTYGKPDCWCYRRQCRGDADNGQQFGVLWVYSNDLGIFLSAYAQPSLPPGGICADFDRAAQFGVLRVYSNDLSIFLTYYAQPTVPCCDNNQDCVLDASDDYNFWKP